MKQITQFRGRQVRVDTSEGYIQGSLAFFNFDEQVIHLNEYKEYKVEKGKEEKVAGGEMIVLNKGAWSKLRVL